MSRRHNEHIVWYCIADKASINVSESLASARSIIHTEQTHNVP